MKYTDRSRYLYDYKTKNDKVALEKLILTYVPYIKTVISKYNDYYDLDELMSVGLESVLNSIITYPNNSTLKLLSARISKYLNLDIYNFVNENKLDISYDEYFKNNKNNEQYTYITKLDLLETNLDEELNTALNKLKPIEKRIIEMKFGLNNKKKMTLMEIAIELSCSFQYIDKVEKNALKKIYSSHSKRLIKFL